MARIRQWERAFRIQRAQKTVTKPSRPTAEKPTNLKPGQIIAQRRARYCRWIPTLELYELTFVSIKQKLYDLGYTDEDFPKNAGKEFSGWNSALRTPQLLTEQGEPNEISVAKHD